MKIIALQPTATAGGAQRSFAALVRLLPEFGVEPSVVVLEDGPLTEWLKRDGVAFRREAQPRLREPAQILALARRLRQLTLDCGAEAIFANMTKAHVYAGLAARMAGRPEVWWQRGVPDGGLFERVAARIPAAATVASSEFALAAQLRLNGRQRLVKIHPGVDVSHISARSGCGRSVREALGWQDKVIVGMVGRLERWKGQDTLLAAAKRLAEEHPQARFLLVGGRTHGGEGDYPDRVQQLPRILGIEDRVHFAGQQDDVLPWFDAMDVVVHGSRSEAFGRVIVEAMALGRPVIATRLGGPSEIIEDGRSGVLIPPDDPEAMAAALRPLLADAALRQAFGAAASTRSALFTERRSAEALASLLRRVADGKTIAIDHQGSAMRTERLR